MFWRTKYRIVMEYMREGVPLYYVETRDWPWPWGRINRDCGYASAAIAKQRIDDIKARSRKPIVVTESY